MKLEFLNTSTDRVDSSGNFRLCPHKLRERLQELLPHPSYSTLKFVQAASNAKAEAIDFRFDKFGGYEVTFSSSNAWWDEEMAERAFRDPLGSPTGALKDLAIGFLSSNFESLLISSPGQQMRICLGKNELEFETETDTNSKAYSTQLKSHTAGELHCKKHLLRSRCRLTNCRVKINGVEQSRDPLPGILAQKTIEAEAGSFGLTLPSRDDYISGDESFMQSGQSDQPLLILGTSGLGREISLESMFLLSDGFSGENTICYVKDGVIIEKRYLDWDYGDIAGAAAFIDASDLRTDPTGLRILGNIDPQIDRARQEWTKMCEAALQLLDSDSFPIQAGFNKFLDSDFCQHAAAWGAFIPMIGIDAGAVPNWVALPALSLNGLVTKHHHRRGGPHWRQRKLWKLERILERYDPSLNI